MGGRGFRRAQLPSILVFLLAIMATALAACSSGPAVPAAQTNSKTANQLVAAGLAAERAGNVNGAVAYYKAAAAKDANNKYAAYDLGYIYQEAGNTSQAAAEYRRALLIDPNFEQALYNMGVLEAPGNPALAITYYDQDLKLDPNNPSANFNLGVLLIKQGQTAQGNTYLATGLRLNPALSADVPPGITVPTTTTTTS